MALVSWQLGSIREAELLGRLHKLLPVVASCRQSWAQDLPLSCCSAGYQVAGAILLSHAVALGRPSGAVARIDVHSDGFVWSSIIIQTASSICMFALWRDFHAAAIPRTSPSPCALNLGKSAPKQLLQGLTLALHFACAQQSRRGFSILRPAEVVPQYVAKSRSMTSCALRKLATILHTAGAASRTKVQECGGCDDMCSKPNWMTCFCVHTCSLPSILTTHQASDMHEPA
eukprot:2376054-Amphidinium_carterae.3